jgi:hypothetical protein
LKIHCLNFIGKHIKITLIDLQAIPYIIIIQKKLSYLEKALFIYRTITTQQGNNMLRKNEARAINALENTAPDVSKLTYDKDDFTLFKDPLTRKKKHVMNWYVHRADDIRSTLHAYKDNPMLHSRINVLFRNMEMNGPSRPEFDKFKYDKKNDMYHCHPIESKKNTTYVVMWEVDEERKIINIVALGPHENFNFERREKKERNIQIAIEARANDSQFVNHEKIGLAATGK